MMKVGIGAVTRGGGLRVLGSLGSVGFRRGDGQGDDDLRSLLLTKK